MAKKKGLNKGLNALLGDALGSASVGKQVPESFVEEGSTPSNLASRLKTLSQTQQTESFVDEPVSKDSPPKTASIVEEKDRIQQIALEHCQRGRYQPRRVIDEESLEELAHSIKSQGVIQPITLRPLTATAETGARYEIIAGERRWRAAALAGLDSVPAIVRALSDDEAVAMALIENLQRDDLNPMEEAYAFQRLQQEFELTHQQIADILGKSRATVSNCLRLMSLVKDVKLMLENGDLEMGHARALLSLSDKKQVDAARRVVDSGLTVRQTEALVKQLQQPAKPVVEQPTTTDPNIQQLENDLSEKLGVPVAVRHNSSGRGLLTLKYNSLDELDGILAHIK